MNPRWQVSFKGPLTEEAKNRLADVGASVVASRLRLGPDGTEYPRGATVWINAVDADAAIRTLKETLADYGHFGGFTATPVSYWMYLGFLESERQAIEVASQQIGLEDPRVSMVVMQEPSKGSAEVLLELPAPNRDDAVAQALAVYRDLRQRAGLARAEPLYGFLGATGNYPTVPIPVPARHEELARRAEALFAEGAYDFVVVTAQTACERLVFDGINELIDAHSGTPTGEFARTWFGRNGQTPSLRDDRLQDLWTALTGDEVQKQDGWWDAYCKHIVRRHGVVHRGTEPTESEARESLVAADAFRSHVEATLENALKR